MKTILMLAAAAMAMMAAPASATTQLDDKAKVAKVREMVDAWRDKDWRKAGELLTENAVLHSMMVDPVVGRDEIVKRFTALGAGAEGPIVLDLKHIGVIDGVVYIERVDRFTYKGHKGDVPVVGVLEFEGPLIKEWREYYDRNQLLKEMGLQGDFAH